jgi:hypothetical protein
VVCDCTNDVLLKGRSHIVLMVARRFEDIHTFDYTGTYFDYDGWTLHSDMVCDFHTNIQVVFNFLCADPKFLFIMSVLCTRVALEMERSRENKQCFM